MGRTRHEEIINAENKGIALLMRKYVGDDSYKDVARCADVDPSTLSNICRGKVQPTIEILYKFGQHPRNGVFFADWMQERFPLAVNPYSKKYSKVATKLTSLGQLKRLLAGIVYDDRMSVSIMGATEFSVAINENEMIILFDEDNAIDELIANE